MKKKKKSQFKALMGAVAVLVLLLAVNFVLGALQTAEENETETEETVEFPVSLSEDEITRVSITNETGTMTFEKEDDTWSYGEDADFPLDQDLLSAKLDTLASLTANRELEGVEDLSEYGLDDPAIEVTVDTDEESYTLGIGDSNSSTGDYYVKVDGEDTVYTLSSTMPTAMAMDIYDVIVADDFPILTTTDMTGIKVESDEVNAEFTKEETDGTSTWILTDSSGTENSVDSTQMDTLLSSTSALSYSSYVDYTDDHLADYGLDDPAAKITITTQETEAAEEEESEVSGEDTEEAESEVSEADTEEVTSEVSGEDTEETASEVSGEDTEETASEVSEEDTEEAAGEVSEADTEEAASEVSGADTEEATSEVSEADTEEAASDTTEGDTESEEETETEPEKVTVVRTLLVGSQDEDGNYYVKLEGNPGVHTMSESTLSAFLEMDELDYMDLYVNDVPMTDLDSLEVTFDGKTKVLTVETEEVVETEEETEAESGSESDAQEEAASENAADEEELLADGEISSETAENESETETETEVQTTTVYHYMVDAFEADETEFATFYNNLIALRAQRRLAEEDAEVSGTLELTLTFTRLDGTTLTTEYYLGSDGLYTVISDQALPAKVSKLDVDAMISDYKELIGWQETETEAESDSESEAVSEAEGESEVVSESETESETGSEAVSESEAENETESEAVSESEAESETESEVVSESEAESETESEAA